ncbi:WSSV599 [White spot syndrome virus]|uniref:WSSV599 n=1 Tax=White spot syndrome virus TaxID=342409 RepID=A0A2I6SCN5_9VIRU|nr:WSSV599 [White spot syndrome virus]
MRELALKELFPEETTSPQVLSRQHDVSTREDLCNESMNAGRAESILATLILESTWLLVHVFTRNI